MDINKCVTLDVECYKNYFLAMFSRVSDGKKIYTESFNDSLLNIQLIRNMLKKYMLITFNGNKYDRLMCEAACKGFNNAKLHKISQHIITENAQPWEVRRKFGLTDRLNDKFNLLQDWARSALKSCGEK